MVGRLVTVVEGSAASVERRRDAAPASSRPRALEKLHLRAVQSQEPRAYAGNGSNGVNGHGNLSLAAIKGVPRPERALPLSDEELKSF
jgi:hypothetical protein